MGGRIAGDARSELEHKTGKPVVTKENYLKRLAKKQTEVERLESDSYGAK